MQGKHTIIAGEERFTHEPLKLDAKYTNILRRKLLCPCQRGLAATGASCIADPATATVGRFVNRVSTFPCSVATPHSRGTVGHAVVGPACRLPIPIAKLPSSLVVNHAQQLVGPRAGL
jgi:hypothetical protein